MTELRAHLTGLIEAINADPPDIEYIHARARLMGLALDQHEKEDEERRHCADTVWAMLGSGGPDSSDQDYAVMLDFQAAFGLGADDEPA